MKCVGLGWSIGSWWRLSPSLTPRVLFSCVHRSGHVAESTRTAKTARGLASRVSFRLSIYFGTFFHFVSQGRGDVTCKTRPAAATWGGQHGAAIGQLRRGDEAHRVS
jgi:hypothetical protein